MILAITGPTGVGKTKLSIELAKIYGGEIINCDSMQIYKGLDVGTAKVTKEEKHNIPHHLLSIKEVNEPYTVYDYQKDARKCIEEIKSRGKIPIFVGGTGFYLKAALYDYEFEENDRSHPEKYETWKNKELEKKINTYETELSYDPQNRQRMIRLLEHLENGNVPKKQNFKLLYPDTIFIGLTTNREELYQRIDKRFDAMVVPLIDEVKPFFIQGIRTKPLMTGIGYKELFDFFDNKKTLQEVVEECKQNSRNYAKRQYTWFQNQMDIHWIETNYQEFNKTVEESIKYIEQTHKTISGS